MGLGLSLLGGLAVTTRLSHSLDSTLSFDEAVTRVEISLDRGRVELTGAPSPGATVERSDRSLVVGMPGGTTRAGDGVLRVTGVCPGGLVLRCRTMVRAGVPATAELNVGAGEAAVSISGMASSVRVTTSGGDVSARDVAGGVIAVTTGSGDVDAQGLAAPQVIVESGGGEVTVALTAVPRSVRIVTASGDVELSVPGGEYRIEAQTAIGVLTSDIPSTPGSPRTITIQAELGDITIRRAPPAPQA